jgi:hypothetical protein
MKPVIPLEKDIQRQICEWLQLKKYFFWRANNIPVYGKNNAGNKTFRSLPKFTPRGLPDIMLINKGIFVAIEVKRPGMKLRPEQADFGLKCVENNARYYVVSSIEDVENNLKDLDTYFRSNRNL